MIIYGFNFGVKFFDIENNVIVVGIVCNVIAKKEDYVFFKRFVE